jgi:cobalt/nickel transport protein
LKTISKLWIGLGVLALLSPLGLLLPHLFHSGAAWGEWGTDEIKGLVGYVPVGMEKLASLWHALLPDYAVSGWDAKGPGHQGVGYILSALLGIAVCFVVVYFAGKLLARKAS